MGDDQLPEHVAMTTDPSQPRTKRWRSRAFAQPLLITILGVWVVPTLVLLAWTASLGPRSDGSPCTGECGTARFTAGLVGGMVFLLAWFVEVVIVGLIVGRSSPEYRLALGALMVGVVLPPIGVAIVLLPGDIAIRDDVLFAIASYLTGAVAAGLLVMIPGLLGFGLGRWARPT